MDSEKKKRLREEFFAEAERVGDPGRGLLVGGTLLSDPHFLPDVRVEWRGGQVRQIVSVRAIVVREEPPNRFEPSNRGWA